MFLPFGLPPEIVAAAEREFARWRREDEEAAKVEPESNVIWADFNTKTWHRGP